MKKIILIFSLVFSLMSCSNDDSKSSEVKFSTVVQGDHNGSGTIAASKLVIKDAAAWIELRNKIQYLSAYYNEAEIDFTKEQLIVAIDKVQTTGGYSIDITKITENKNNIMVTIEQLKTGGDNTVITQPYHVVRMPKSGKEVVFK